MKRFVTISLAVLGVLGLFAPAWANEEMHPGGRLFYPLWDVSTSSRVTFIIITRLALNDNNSIVGSINSTSFNTTRNFRPKNPDDNCRPFGAGGSQINVNRTDAPFGGTNDSPVFVDDVHLEYYGKNCDSGNETIHMSCADIDLLFLSSNNPRKGFSQVSSQGQGAVDVHRIVNSTLSATQREDENALMGHAVIVDITEGWAATYPAAAAKVTECAGLDAGTNTGLANLCSNVDGGTNFGYEPFPQEVYLPFAFADGFTNSGAFRNLISLWAPGLMPGGAAGNVNLDIKWWDGRERPFTSSLRRHALVDTLSSISGGQFNLSNFICGHTGDANTAENDGFPRDGTQPCAGSPSAAADPTHKSDNFETGIQLQSSTPLGWWRFNRIPAGPAPTTLPRLGTGGTALSALFDGKGLVGVVLSSAAPTASAAGIGDATRLWHKDPCEETTHGVLRGFGPPHLRDKAAGVFPADAFLDELEVPDTIVFFNAYGPGNVTGAGSELGQQQICRREMFNYTISTPPRPDDD